MSKVLDCQIDNIKYVVYSSQTDKEASYYLHVFNSKGNQIGLWILTKERGNFCSRTTEEVTDQILKQVSSIMKMKVFW